MANRSGKLRQKELEGAGWVRKGNLCWKWDWSTVSWCPGLYCIAGIQRSALLAFSPLKTETYARMTHQEEEHISMYIFDSKALEPGKLLFVVVNYLPHFQLDLDFLWRICNCWMQKYSSEGIVCPTVGTWCSDAHGCNVLCGLLGCTALAIAVRDMVVWVWVGSFLCNYEMSAWWIFEEMSNLTLYHIHANRFS